MDNNKAFVAYLGNITPIPDATKIVKADVLLNNTTITQVVVGLDMKNGDKVVYLDSNMVLSDQVMKDYPELATYTSKGRIKVVKLRGCISNGLVIEVSKLSQYDKAILSAEEGFSFTSLGNTEICHKYMPPIKVHIEGTKKGRKGRVESRMIEGQFHFHVDTAQLARNIGALRYDSIISISRKIHGTSAIASNCLVKRPLSFKENIAQWCGIPVNDTEYAMVYASRSVVKNGAVGAGFYGTDLWSSVGKGNFEGKLKQGETVYYEIVGYLPGSSSMIQKDYDYGCAEGQCKIAVYRITLTGADGTVSEYSWAAMKERCVQLCVPMVEEYYYGALDSFLLRETGIQEWRPAFIEQLRKTYLEKTCPDCKKRVPDEGIVLRVEGLGIEVYKLKSEAFYLKESETHDKEEDIEESA